MLVSIPNMRCTANALAKFASCGTTYETYTFTPDDIVSTWSDFAATSDAIWKYMDCKYHTDAGGMTMHSYV